MATQTVANKDIYYSLPTFPEHDGKQYTAIVTGANGISGAYIARTLAESPQRWKTIYALSRRSPVNPVGGNVKYLSVDFLKSPEEIAQALAAEGVKA
jgi:NAD(P)-dependent dehydrogenase (short-subunit alcohol dehydrogenase family)